MIKRNWMGYYALALSCFVASCEEEIQDTVAPDISITSPMLDTKLWLGVSVKADVTDDHLVSKVEFYLDDELLGEDTEAPYELDFNSKQYEDGMYELKVLAYDGGGNQTEASQDIEIFNSLLKVSVGDNYLESNEEEWIVVGTHEGEVLETIMIENSEEYVFARPDDYLEDKINVMVISRNMYDTENEAIDILQMQNLYPESWTLKGNQNSKDSIGTATINFSNSQEERVGTATHNISHITFNRIYNDSDSIIRNNIYKIAKEPARVLTYIHNYTDNTVPRYHWIPEIESEKEYNLINEDFIPMNLWQNITLPPNSSVFYNIRGRYKNSEVYEVMRNSFSGNLSSLSMYVPGETFEGYRYGISIRNDNYFYYKTELAKPDEILTIPEVSYEITDNSMESFSSQVNFEGDFCSNLWRYRYRTDTELKNVYWYIDSDISEGKVEAKKMSIPEAIINRYSLLSESKDNFVHEEIMFYDYKGISSLNEFVKETYHYDNDIIDYEFLIFEFDNPNAKISQDKEHEVFNKKRMEKHSKIR
ncbi:Ig-like domain-containing protein [Catalinimonas sp. 4WD22]|uniref:Ig-like domain-containing protein n=1 Tax=Catalinimonas locisalis TaxID=3133978 RepID=UPI003101716D